jgi:hypothetical protein
VLLLVDGDVYLPLLVRGKLPAQFGARLLMLSLQQNSYIVSQRVVMLHLLVLMPRLVVVVVGCRMLMFLLVDSGLMLVGLLELSMVFLLVLC